MKTKGTPKKTSKRQMNFGWMQRRLAMKSEKSYCCYLLIPPTRTAQTISHLWKNVFNRLLQL